MRMNRLGEFPDNSLKSDCYGNGTDGDGPLLNRQSLMGHLWSMFLQSSDKIPLIFKVHDHSLPCVQANGSASTVLVVDDDKMPRLSSNNLEREVPLIIHKTN
jgi:hypothetical protein